MSFVDPAFDWYSASVSVNIYVIFCNIRPRYNGTRLYLPTVGIPAVMGTLRDLHIWKHDLVCLTKFTVLNIWYRIANHHTILMQSLSRDTVIINKDFFNETTCFVVVWKAHPGYINDDSFGISLCMEYICYRRFCCDVIQSSQCNDMSWFTFVFGKLRKYIFCTARWNYFYPNL